MIKNISSFLRVLCKENTKPLSKPSQSKLLIYDEYLNKYVSSDELLIPQTQINTTAIVLKHSKHFFLYDLLLKKFVNPKLDLLIKFPKSTGCNIQTNNNQAVSTFSTSPKVFSKRKHFKKHGSGSLQCSGDQKHEEVGDEIVGWAGQQIKKPVTDPRPENSNAGGGPGPGKGPKKKKSWKFKQAMVCDTTKQKKQDAEDSDLMILKEKFPVEDTLLIPEEETKQPPECKKPKLKENAKAKPCKKLESQVRDKSENVPRSKSMTKEGTKQLPKSTKTKPKKTLESKMFKKPESKVCGKDKNKVRIKSANSKKEKEGNQKESPCKKIVSETHKDVGKDCKKIDLVKKDSTAIYLNKPGKSEPCPPLKSQESKVCDKTEKIKAQGEPNNLRGSTAKSLCDEKSEKMANKEIASKKPSTSYNFMVPSKIKRSSKLNAVNTSCNKGQTEKTTKCSKLPDVVNKPQETCPADLTKSQSKGSPEDCKKIRPNTSDLANINTEKKKECVSVKQVKSAGSFKRQPSKSTQLKSKCLEEEQDKKSESVREKNKKECSGNISVSNFKPTNTPTRSKKTLKVKTPLESFIKKKSKDTLRTGCGEKKAKGKDKTEPNKSSDKKEAICNQSNKTQVKTSNKLQPYSKSKKDLRKSGLKTNLTKKGSGNNLKIKHEQNTSGDPCMKNKVDITCPEGDEKIKQMKKKISKSSPSKTCGKTEKSGKEVKKSSSEPCLSKTISEKDTNTMKKKTQNRSQTSLNSKKNEKVKCDKSQKGEKTAIKQKKSKHKLSSKKSSEGKALKKSKSKKSSKSKGSQSSSKSLKSKSKKKKSKETCKSIPDPCNEDSMKNTQKSLNGDKTNQVSSKQDVSVKKSKDKKGKQNLESCTQKANIESKSSKSKLVETKDSGKNINSNKTSNAKVCKHPSNLKSKTSTGSLKSNSSVKNKKHSSNMSDVQKSTKVNSSGSLNQNSREKRGKICSLQALEKRGSENVLKNTKNIQSKCYSQLKTQEKPKHIEQYLDFKESSDKRINFKETLSPKVLTEIYVKTNKSQSLPLKSESKTQVSQKTFTLVKPFEQVRDSRNHPNHDSYNNNLSLIKHYVLGENKGNVRMDQMNSSITGLASLKTSNRKNPIISKTTSLNGFKSTIDNLTAVVKHTDDLKQNKSMNMLKLKKFGLIAQPNIPANDNKMQKTVSAILVENSIPMKRPISVGTLNVPKKADARSNTIQRKFTFGMKREQNGGDIQQSRTDKIFDSVTALKAKWYSDNNLDHKAQNVTQSSKLNIHDWNKKDFKRKKSHVVNSKIGSYQSNFNMDCKDIINTYGSRRNDCEDMPTKDLLFHMNLSDARNTHDLLRTKQTNEKSISTQRNRNARDSLSSNGLGGCKISNELRAVKTSINVSNSQKQNLDGPTRLVNRMTYNPKFHREVPKYTSNQEKQSNTHNSIRPNMIKLRTDNTNSIAILHSKKPLSKNINNKAIKLKATLRVPQKNRNIFALNKKIKINNPKRRINKNSTVVSLGLPKTKNLNDPLKKVKLKFQFKEPTTFKNVNLGLNTIVPKNTITNSVSRITASIHKRGGKENGQVVAPPLRKEGDHCKSNLKNITLSSAPSSGSIHLKKTPSKGPVKVAEIFKNVVVASKASKPILRPDANDQLRMSLLDTISNKQENKIENKRVNSVSSKTGLEGKIKDNAITKGQLEENSLQKLIGKKDVVELTKPVHNSLSNENIDTNKTEKPPQVFPKLKETNQLSKASIKPIMCYSGNEKFGTAYNNKAVKLLAALSIPQNRTKGLEPDKKNMKHFQNKEDDKLSKSVNSKEEIPTRESNTTNNKFKLTKADELYDKSVAKIKEILKPNELKEVKRSQLNLKPLLGERKINPMQTKSIDSKVGWENNTLTNSSNLENADLLKKNNIFKLDEKKKPTLAKILPKPKECNT